MGADCGLRDVGQVPEASRVAENRPKQPSDRNEHQTNIAEYRACEHRDEGKGLRLDPSSDKALYGFSNKPSHIANPSSDLYENTFRVAKGTR